jgi:hypothetical protein
MQYKVICKPEKLFSLDLNMVVLFAMAVGIVYIAFHTPELYIVTEMTDEELEGTEFKVANAIFFFFAASCMLLTLYLFIDYIGKFLEVIITFTSGMSVAVIVQEILIYKYPQKLFPLTGNPKELKLFKIPVLGYCFGEMNWLDYACMTTGLVISALWFFTKSWLLNNLLGICMCLTFLKTIRLN